MCGIAGAVDLAGHRFVPQEVLHAMASAIIHRGPDEDGYFQQAGVSLASRRLSIRFDNALTLSTIATSTVATVAPNGQS